MLKNKHQKSIIFHIDSILKKKNNLKVLLNYFHRVFKTLIHSTFQNLQKRNE